MKVVTTCNYCGNTEIFYVYELGQVKDRKCEICKDTSKKIRKEDEDRNPFGY